MDLKSVLYTTAGVVWTGVVAGAWVAVDRGVTEPWLTFSDIPGGSGGGIAAGIVLLFLGWIVIGRVNAGHERAVWEAAGKQVGLRPATDGRDAADRELTGTVDGRPVSAWYDKRKRGGGGDSNPSYVTFTSVEAELAAPADEGIVVGSTGDSVSVDDGLGTLDFDDVAGTADGVEGLVAVEAGNLVLVGTSVEALESVADGLSGDALRAINDLKIASIGDAAGVVDGWAEARNEQLEAAGSSVLEYPVDNLVQRVPGDAATVTVETRSSIQDGEVLRRFAEGVGAVADAFEEATAHTPASE